MNVDLKTVSLIYVILTFVQTVIFAQQYLKNKEAKEIRWWFLWSALLSVSFALVLMRGSSSLFLRNLVITLQNVFMTASAASLYLGTVKFFGRKVHYYKHIAAIIFLTFVYILFTFAHYDPYYRSILTNSYLAFYVLAAAYYLFKKQRYKRYSIIPVLISAFLILGIMLVLRVAYIASGSLHPENMFVDHPLNYLSYLVLLGTSVVFTFSFVVLLNERLSEKINEAKDHFELLFSLSPDDIAITRLSDGLILNINESYSKITGYSKSEAIGKTTTEINLWIEPEQRKKFVKEIEDKGICNNFEVDFKAKDGRIVSGLLSARVIDISGKKHIISTNRDITKLKILEREKLAEAEKWEKTFDGISDSVFLLDTDGKVIKYNSATEKILGKGDYIGKHCWEIVHKTIGHIENCPFVRMENSLKRESMLLNVREKWYEVTVDPMLNDGILTGAVHIISDITARKKSEDELNSSMAELRQMNSLMVGREIKMTE
ncbi:MAG: PAS domain-containing protein, partial [Candidatus Delongbacteria bacterium]|nr:PAS domain-containing protein [Candidatus Delongbacteria bacterium]